MEPMSDATENDTLCQRCSLLSFDDLALGGQGLVYEDGVARLHFPDARIEFRPEHWTQEDTNPPDYQLVRLDWEMEDILPDMPRLSHSSQLGCVFCQALFSSLEDAFAEEAKSYTIHDGTLDSVAYLSLVDGGIEGLLVETTFNRNRFDVRERNIRTIFPIEADRNCEEWLGAEPVREKSYLDPMSIGTIHRFLDHCTSRCHPRIPSPFLPTRLIDVGHDASVVPRLVLCSDIRETKQTQYAALSYCWGNKKDAETQFKTKKASLEDRCKGLPNEFITPTTKDAIAITREIGLRYIWIDALCIIQDDKDDWLHESSQMDLVYRHAFVTFCVLNSNSCHEGFLSRAPVVKVPFQSNLRNHIKGAYFIRLVSRNGSHLDRTEYVWDYALSKWRTRCWTYQEQEMSTRRLLFGSLKIHFTCPKCEWSEGDQVPRNYSRSKILDQVVKFKQSRISAKELYEEWESSIHSYGQRTVTLDKDRLPAIAGLARIIGEALQDHYLAGLWKGDLLEGLMWHGMGTTLSRGLDIHLQNIRLQNYVAPSWSWASCPAVGSGRQIYQHLRRITREATIVDVGVDTDSKDPYGQVSGGFLRIRGKLAALPTWLPEDDDEWTNSWFHTTGPGIDRFCTFTDWLHKDKEARLELLVVMLLFSIEHDDETEAPYLRALLLHPANESKQYYRVGVVSSDGPGAYELMVNCFKDSQEDTICII